jgi:hypothetical protein
MRVGNPGKGNSMCTDLGMFEALRGEQCKCGIESWGQSEELRWERWSRLGCIKIYRRH